MRTLLVLLLTLGGALSATHGASAATEFCPAWAELLPVVLQVPANTVALPSPDRYAIVLSSLVDKTVSGPIDIHTSSGWYSVNFPSTALTKKTVTYETENGSFDRAEYQSGMIFVKFPQALTAASAFFPDSETCAPPPDSLEIPAVKDLYALHHISKRAPAYILGSPNSGAIDAKPIAAPGSDTCDLPFAYPQPNQLVMPNRPATGMIPALETVLMEVAVDAKGNAIDDWVVSSTGSKAVERSALKAARETSYYPARAFCKNVPGIYLFQADFMPQ